MNDKYKLNEKGEPVVEPNLIAWAMWFEKADRQLALTKVTPDIRVSTVFLGLDYNFVPDGPPLLWETMVFPDTYSPESQHQARYSTREEALDGHTRIVGMIRKALDTSEREMEP